MTACYYSVYCDTDASVGDNHVSLRIIFQWLRRKDWHRNEMCGLRAKLEIWDFLSTWIQIRVIGYPLSDAASYISGLIFKGETYNILGNFRPWRRDHYVATRRREKNTHWPDAKS
jgi:hypothetical protein